MDKDLIAVEPPLSRNRDFLLLWSGAAVSALGTSVSMFAYPLVVIAITGSAAAAGLVAFFATLPHLVVQLPAGVLVDRANRKALMVASDIIRAVALTSIAAAIAVDRFWLVHFAVVAFVEGACAVVASLCARAAVRHVVPVGQLSKAYARSQARDRAAQLVGSPLGGILLGIGRWVPFVFDAVTYVVSAIALLLIRKPFQDGAPPRRRAVLAEIREGVRWLFGQPFIRVTTLLVAGSNLIFQAIFLGVLVLLSQRGASTELIGLVIGAAGVGGVLGAVTAPWITRRASLTSIVIGANWIWAALVPALVITPSPVVMGVVLALIAFIGPVWNIAIEVFRLRMTPDELQGRVSAAANLLALGAIPIGSLVGGLVLQQFAARTAVFVMAGALALLALCTALSPSVRRGAADLVLTDPNEARDLHRQCQPPIETGTTGSTAHQELGQT